MAPSDPEFPNQLLKIINASLFRMGTKSMAEAYKILGYHTHHALDDSFAIPWKLIEEAAEATWPNIPGARRRPRYTRHDWDTVWGAYEAVTDLAFPFATELVQAYPDAKVVVVQRDFDSWWPSFLSENINIRFNRVAEVVNHVAVALFDFRGGRALSHLYLGFFGASNVDEIQDHARETYNRYFEDIRRLVPSGRRLEYSLNSGWEPLCAILGKDVPNLPFPRVNEQAQHREKANANIRKVYFMLARKGFYWVLMAIVIGYLAWRIVSQQYSWGS